MKIGIIREGKVPPDFRTPLSPQQCIEVQQRFPTTQIVVQPSPIRRFCDQEYRDAGIEMSEDLSTCDILMGIKEVPVEQLIQGKTYLFFSHTLKKQPHNAKLLHAILNKKIRLIDYEALRNKEGRRIIGFGRYAGIVGVYEAFRAYGKKHGLYDLKSPADCHDRAEMEDELQHIRWPETMKIVITGFGRVGNGAEEIMKILPVERISVKQLMTQAFSHPVYLHLDTAEYYERKVAGGFEKKDFYNNPEHYFSILPRFVRRSDLYIACHLWSSSNPVLISQQDMQHPDWKCHVIADISCDINGPIASTIRASKIADPLYGYDRWSGLETDWKNPEAICVMAVDNLPCELPRDASVEFGRELIEKVFPLLLHEEDPDDTIWHASETTLDGELTPHFEYLRDYAAG